ncbi:hypothetical protein CVT26_011688, partial [Gymnopilus dilepis]
DVFQARTAIRSVKQETGKSTKRSYDHHFRDGLLSLALITLKVSERFGQLSAIVVPVVQPPPKRFNNIRFLSAHISSLYFLDADVRDSVHRRLDLCFPAMTIGYSIVSEHGPIGARPAMVPTFTHTFTFPFSSKSDIEVIDIIQLIRQRETQAREAAATPVAHRKEGNSG